MNRLSTVAVQMLRLMENSIDRSCQRLCGRSAVVAGRKVANVLVRNLACIEPVRA